MTLEEIGRAIGVSFTTVRLKAIALGLSIQSVRFKCKWSDEQLEWLKENYPTKPLCDLAQHIGYSIPTVQKKALELGLKRSDDYNKKKFYRRYVKDYKSMNEDK